MCSSGLFISKNLTQKNSSRGKILDFFLFSKEFTKYLFLTNYLSGVENLFLMLYLKKILIKVDYKKKSLIKLSTSESYEEIDTRLASGWYVDSVDSNKKKKYKTKKVSYTISKKQKVL